MTATTDNQGNQAVIRRCLTTRFPLCLVLMELSTWLEDLDMELDLQWRRRNENEEADNLTNGKFEKFNPSRRVSLCMSTFPWKVIPVLGKDSQDLFTQIAEDKAAGPSNKRVRKPKGEKLRQTDPW